MFTDQSEGHSIGDEASTMKWISIRDSVSYVREESHVFNGVVVIQLPRQVTHLFLRSNKGVITSKGSLELNLDSPEIGDPFN